MKNEIQIIKPKCFDKYSLVAGVTSRIGGVSKDGYSSFNMGFGSGDNKTSVIKNRDILYNYLNSDDKHFVYGKQVHGKEIKIIKESDFGSGAFSEEDAIQGIDGMITNHKGIFITIQTADCMSVFIYCPKKNVIALLHAGWKGTKLNIISYCVSLMKEQFDCNEEDLVVYLGPSISGNHYEVGKEFLGFFSDEVLNQKNDKIYLDLVKANKLNCIRSNILKQNVFCDNFCTFSDRNNFYSYRRDGKHTGRMLSYFALL